MLVVAAFKAGGEGLGGADQLRVIGQVLLADDLAVDGVHLGFEGGHLALQGSQPVIHFLRGAPRELGDQAVGVAVALPELLLEGGAAALQLVEHGVRLGQGFVAQFEQILQAEQLVAHVFDHLHLQQVLRDERRVALAHVFGGAAARAGIVFVEIAAAARVDAPADHGRAAAGAFEQPGEKIVGRFGAGVMDGAHAFLQGFTVDDLHGVPGLGVDDGLAIICDGHIAVDHFALVDRVGKKMVPAALAGVEVCGAGDGVVAVAAGAHLKCLAYQRSHVGIGLPAVHDVRHAVAVKAQVDGRRLAKAARGRAADGAVILDVVAQPALDVGAEVFEEFGVLPVDDVLEQQAVEVVGQVVLQAVDEVAAAAQRGFVELRVVDLAREAAERPHDDAQFGALFGQQIFDHLEEGRPPDGGAARGGFVAEDVSQAELVLAAPGADLAGLLVGAEVLRVAAAVAQVGHHRRAGGKAI